MCTYVYVSIVYICIMLWLTDPKIFLIWRKILTLLIISSPPGDVAICITISLRIHLYGCSFSVGLQRIKPQDANVIGIVGTIDKVGMLKYIKTVNINQFCIWYKWTQKLWMTIWIFFVCTLPRASGICLIQVPCVLWLCWELWKTIVGIS